MFERLLVNLKKRRMHNKAKKARSLISKGRVKRAEEIYRKLLIDYKRFCIKAMYIEKLSIYHDLLNLYNELKKVRGNEEKPVEVKTKAMSARPAVRPVVIVKSARKSAKAKNKSKKSRIIKKAGIQKKADTQKEASKVDAAEEKEKKQAKPAESAESAKPAEHLEEKKEKNMGYAIGQHALLKTALDDLYSCVQQKGNITLLDAASSLKADKAKIEEWAKILDDHSLIKIYYPAFSSPQLISMEWLKKKEDEKKKKEEEKKIIKNKRKNGESEESKELRHN